jgi:predicted AlkP superfamily phosphohydrolase/phosphomutase
LKRLLSITVGVAIAISAVLLFRYFFFAPRLQGHKKVIVLGVDGMDPQLLRRYMDEGIMPNFQRLARTGSFRELQTSVPAQSPVAWSNLITGLNAGGHGIFDFIHRDPKTMELYFSTSRVTPPRHVLHFGSWNVPLAGGVAEQLRKGPAFWQILDRHEVPNSVFRMPANFPPVPGRGVALSGMGVPDLRGTYGTFTFYTDDASFAAGPVEGGEIVPVNVDNSMVHAGLIGPDNSFRSGSPPAQLPFSVAIDPLEPVARIAIDQQQLVLREGEWSGWVHVRFSMAPLVPAVEGICRFYVKQLHPRFELYVSPINIAPSRPALPVANPEKFSIQLAEQLGDFYTQGIAEDTKALSAGVLNDDEFLAQDRAVFHDERRIFDQEFAKFQQGFFFYYFSSLDLTSHMFWRLIDPQHPAYNAEMAQRNGGALPWFYSQIDQVLGEVLKHIDGDTTLLVLSDHGFAPYERSFNLNTWLAQNGYLAVLPGKGEEPEANLGNIDWQHTRAYGLGLNGLYLNLAGREQHGTVAAGKDALIVELRARLLALKDPANGRQAITRVEPARIAYQGPEADAGPDILVGYNRGYRVGWGSILGGVSSQVFEDNTNAWSGDHCIDPSLVPGILLSNHKIEATAPALTDIAPTILREFGINAVDGMIGHSVFSSERSAAKPAQ